MRFSQAYHRDITERYWANTTVTHGDMSKCNFDFYADELRKLIGVPNSPCRVLDYGGGGGEIAFRLNAEGFSVDVAEFSDNFRELIQQKNLKWIEANSLPSLEYDIVIANNCLFYVHPSKLVYEIHRILKSLKVGGSFFITDTPTIGKIGFLTDSYKLQVLFMVTKVFQPDSGGFFMNTDDLHKHFSCIEYDSWCSYRSHFKLLKS